MRLVTVVARIQGELDRAVATREYSQCVVSDVRESLRDFRHCVVRLDHDEARCLDAAKRTAGEWLADSSTLAAIGPATPVSSERSKEFVGVFGGPATFVELRVDAAGCLSPQTSSPLQDATGILSDVARDVMDAIGCPWTLVDDPRTQREDYSTTVLRLCSYDDTSSFGAHTDTTFLTLIPAAATPGLDVFDGARWHRPEKSASSHTDIVVLPGELLELATDGAFKAAVHRVTVDAPRVSMPMLLRGNPNARIGTDHIPMPAAWAALQADSPDEAQRRLDHWGS